MTISKRIRSQLFISSYASAATAEATVTATATGTDASVETMLIRLPLNRPLPGVRKRPLRAKKRLLLAQQQPNQQPQGLGWSDEEHERFLHGLETFPTGPWKEVAAFVGTRTTRQTMTHAQKYRQKIARRQRGLQIQTAAARKPVSTIKSLDDEDNEMTMSTPTTTTTDETVKTEKADLSTIHTSTTVTCGLPTSLATASSPSSTDHVMGDFGCCLSGANAFEGLSATHYSNNNSNSFMPDVGMTADEFRLVTDELYAETLWVNQFDDHQLLLLQDDSLALMFQDPSSFGIQHKQNAVLAMDAVYPAASMWTPASSSMLDHVEAASYVCQL